VRWIVDSILIEDQGLRECGELEQSMPVGVVACKARYFQPEHDPGMT